MNIPFILETHFADCVWTHAGSNADYDVVVDDCGNPLSGLLWGDEDTRQTNVQNPKTKPTLAELQTLWDTHCGAEFANQEVRTSRASEYPPITDYLDGVVKGDQAQIDAYIAACQAVKAKYPKV